MFNGIRSLSGITPVLSKQNIANYNVKQTLLIRVRADCERKLKSIWLQFNYYSKMNSKLLQCESNDSNDACSLIILFHVYLVHIKQLLNLMFIVLKNYYKSS